MLRVEKMLNSGNFSLGEAVNVVGAYFEVRIGRGKCRDRVDRKKLAKVRGERGWFG